MNNWSFTGNLGNPAEVKFLPSGAAVCEFSVAVKSGYGDKQKTNWVKCALFGKKAEGRLPEFLQKGTSVAICGELELQEWEGQNGKGAALSVRVSELDLIGGQPQVAQQPVQQQQAPQQGGYQQQAPQQSFQQQRSPQQQSAHDQSFQQPAPRNNEYQGGHNQGKR